MTRFYFFFIATFLFSFNIQSQDKYISCHHTKNKIRPVPLTALQKTDLLKNIARSDTFDIEHYEIHLDVRDYTGSYLIGNTTVSYTPKMADVTSITLDLLELTVDSIKSNNELLEFTHEGFDLKIQLTSPTTIGEESSITIWYQGIPYLDPEWGGFYFQNNYIYNLGIGISTIPPNFGKTWYPCFDTYVERALYDYYVTSDDNWKAFCQGQLIEEETLDEETVMRHYALDKPIPTYLSAVAIADYESYEYVHTGANGDVPIRLTSKPFHQDEIQTKFQGLGNSIDALEYWFGPEYWGQIGYVITIDGAMEHPTNIAYPQAMLGISTTSNENLYTHELGHHWWGDMVSQSSYNHMWLKEGPAEYSIHLMREWTEGISAYTEAVKNNHLEVLETAHIDDEGFQVLSPIPDQYIYGTHSYNKGASVMHSLRGYMGDELFKQGLQFVLDSTLNSTLDPDKFRSILTLSTGVELEDFFNDWIYKPGFTSFEINSVATTDNNGIITNQIEVQQKLRECPEFYNNVPLEITAFDENLDTYTTDFISQGEFSNAVFETSFTPIFYVINYANKINIAKIDHLQPIWEETNTLTLPFVDFKLKVVAVNDSSNVYVEHQWIAPDSDNIADNIDELSGTHYWIVNGNWNEQTHLEARLNYHGAADYVLDYDLFGEIEEGALLAYRASPQDTWIEYPYYTLFAGSLTNGNGAMRVDSLIRGEYCFAKGNPLVGLINLEDFNHSVHLFPNPVTDFFSIKIDNLVADRVEIFDTKGNLVRQWNNIIIENYLFDVNNLSIGQYFVRIYDRKNHVIATKKLDILR